MTKPIKTFLFFTLLLSGLFLSGQSLRALTINISKGIQLDPDTVKNAFITQDARFMSLDVEIVIYGYSSGSEVYSLADDGSLKMIYKSGEITAMVKLNDKNPAKKIIFLKGTGSDTTTLLRSLAENALQSLGSYLH